MGAAIVRSQSFEEGHEGTEELHTLSCGTQTVTSFQTSVYQERAACKAAGYLRGYLGAPSRLLACSYRIRLLCVGVHTFVCMCVCTCT